MELLKEGFVRLKQIIGDNRVTPPVPGLIPVSRSTFLARVKDGSFPKPVRLSKRCTAWRVEDIRRLIENVAVREG